MNTSLSWGLGLILSSALVARPAHAADTAALANTAMQGAMTMAMISAMDSTASIGSCACLSSSGSECSPPWSYCAMMGLNIASMALGIAQALSSNKTEKAVKTTDFKTPDFNFDPEDLSTTFTDECAKPDAPAYLCQPGGLSKAETDLATLEGMVNDGKVTLTGDQSEGLQKAKSRLASLKKGDFGSVSGDGSAFSDFDEQGSGNAGVATPTGEDGSGGGNGGVGAGGYMNWAGSQAGTSSGSSAGKVGPTGVMLDKTDWNGALDMIDPNTGKSLTLWQRATRRYMGTPDGQRGFTLARIESLRRKSNTKLTDAVAKEERAKRMAEKKKEPAPYRPVVLSPKEFSKH